MNNLVAVLMASLLGGAGLNLMFKWVFGSPLLSFEAHKLWLKKKWENLIK